MFDVQTVEIEWGGRPLKIETGKVARQADGAVIVTYGETTVLATAVAERAPKPGLDFFPLTVNYQEKAYAAGKVPGGYFKREGRPSEKETLVCRLIDRPIRPLFAKGFKNETQIIATVLSHDLENDSDIVAMVATSAALTISGIPFMGPIGAARVGVIDGEYVLNLTIDQMPDSDLDLVVAGTQDAVLMVESEAKELSEDMMLGAVMYGHKEMQAVMDAIIDLAERCAKEPREVPEVDLSELQAKVDAIAADDLRNAYKEADKMTRQEKVAEARDKTLAELAPEDGENTPQDVGACFKSLEKASCVARSSKPRSALMAVLSIRFDRSCRKWASFPGHMAVLCSLVVKHRHLLSSRLAQAKTNSSSTRLKAPIAKTSCCTITSHPSLLGKRAGPGSPVGGKWATASWPGARCTP